MKQKDRQVQERELITLQERVGSLRSHLEMKEMSEEEWEDEKRCSDLKKAWLKDFPKVFKEDLGREDRINIEPIVIDLVPNHEDIHVFHPKLAVDVPAYMDEAARRELQRMLNAGMLEPIQGYTENLSRGFFVEKHSKPGEPVKACLVADFRGINCKLRRPEHPLEGSWGILKHLNPHHKYFAAVDFSSGFSQLPLAEESRHLFNIILPWGKYRYCVLPQGLNVSHKLFDINTAEEIRNTPGIWKNSDDVLGGGRKLEELDERMRRIFSVVSIKVTVRKKDKVGRSYS